MTLEQWSNLSQIIGAVGVVVSLLVVAFQIRANTGALQRNEHNSTMEQWTVVRMAIAQNRDVAELMTAGLGGERPLDSADQLRMEQMLQEIGWAAFHIWDRTQRGIFPPGTFELTGGAYFSLVINTARGSIWWHKAKGVGFAPPFVADVEAMPRAEGKTTLLA